MTIIIKRRENESNERLIRRFSRRVQTSGLLLRAKKRLHLEPRKNKNKQKRDALRRLRILEMNDYLRKIQAIDDDRERGPARRSSRSR